MPLEGNLVCCHARHSGLVRHLASAVEIERLWGAPSGDFGPRALGVRCTAKSRIRKPERSQLFRTQTASGPSEGSEVTVWARRPPRKRQTCYPRGGLKSPRVQRRALRP